VAERLSKIIRRAGLGIFVFCGDFQRLSCRVFMVHDLPKTTFRRTVGHGKSRFSRLGPKVESYLGREKVEVDHFFNHVVGKVSYLVQHFPVGNY
jgi:hypothetical protein